MGLIRRVSSGKTLLILSLLAGAFVPQSPAGADETPPSQSYSVFDPVPDDALRPFCTDRPTKGTGVCTIDAGHFQIELDIFNATFQNADGVTTSTYLYTSPNVKLGLTDNVDLEVAFSPLVTVDMHDHKTGAHARISGFGDMVLRVKTNLAGNSGGDFGIALDPYVKLPTAGSGIGNGAVEEGLVVPMAFGLSDVWSVSLVPEIDILKNALDDGRHVAEIAALGITRSFADNITASAELWADNSNDPASSNTQYSFDLAATWQPPDTKDLQFDVGANFGLNRNTPGSQIYVGISHRF